MNELAENTQESSENFIELPDSNTIVATDRDWETVSSLINLNSFP